MVLSDYLRQLHENYEKYTTIFILGKRRGKEKVEASLHTHVCCYSLSARCQGGYDLVCLCLLLEGERYIAFHEHKYTNEEEN